MFNNPLSLTDPSGFLADDGWYTFDSEWGNGYLTVRATRFDPDSNDMWNLHTVEQFWGSDTYYYTGGRGSAPPQTTQAARRIDRALQLRELRKKFTGADYSAVCGTACENFGRPTPDTDFSDPRIFADAIRQHGLPEIIQQEMRKLTEDVALYSVSLVVPVPVIGRGVLWAGEIAINSSRGAQALSTARNACLVASACTITISASGNKVIGPTRHVVSDIRRIEYIRRTSEIGNYLYVAGP